MAAGTAGLKEIGFAERTQFACKVRMQSISG
jgi:hypothetical protein